MSEHKSEDSFRVIDRRLFTEEGELRKEAAEEAAREAVKEAELAKQEVAKEQSAAEPAEQKETPLSKI